MEESKRKTGIEVVGDVSWGTHFCLFYQGKQDLADVLVPYFKAGLENNEFCMWITSDPLVAKDAKRSLEREVRNLDEYFDKGQIEILDYDQWYTKSGKFDAERVLDGWAEKEEQALKKGFEGLRLTGNTFWLEKNGWKDFYDYEEKINSVIGKYRMIAVCTYSLEKCGASEILDVVANHQFAMIKREGKWQTVIGAEHKKAEEEIGKYREHLEEMIKERTLELDEKVKGLETFHDAAVDRELKMEELRNKVKELESRLKEKR